MSEISVRSEHATRLSELIERYCTPEWKQLMRERNVQLTFRKGQHVFQQGQVAEHMFMIESGGVKVSATYEKSRDRIVRIAGPGEVVGYRALGDHMVYTATVTALMDTVVNSIPLSLFTNVLKANNAFCYHFLLFFANELRALDQQLRDHLEMSVLQRVAKALKLNLETFGTDAKDPKRLSFTLSRTDIARLADTSYESVIRSLTELQRAKVIALAGKQIRILKRREMERMAAPFR
ncbi:MAG TPA: Crp/Fnr family transcriptional regulator [Flavobacteriales bacterium]|nr:Crp/Fnr family transcriptional regulator [Flavobacteriales bacterium]MCC6655290.1 Crp/Fnr family transcriptional regulator [Flavobacteriales bacterium]HMU12466.1 Crp/Fnr family transcriptional regulator [Flavobacteriales bacterium]HMW97531.1 Crp/Fnr family transcriptional regulator [Flavobacteriales bacterium]HNA31641.1 Crp/Fnr family transcriptional regulator [Flavobacteriales bacterium]